MLDLQPVSSALDEVVQRTIDSKTKPLGALGSIETLAGQIARIQGTLTLKTLESGIHAVSAVLYNRERNVERRGA